MFFSCLEPLIIDLISLQLVSYKLLALGIS